MFCIYFLQTSRITFAIIPTPKGVVGIIAKEVYGEAEFNFLYLFAANLCKDFFEWIKLVYILILKGIERDFASGILRPKRAFCINSIRICAKFLRKSFALNILISANFT